MEKVKKVAVINDLSGVGRCSLSAALPILSCIGVQCVPFPTAILSNQTNYKNYYFHDFTNYMREYKENIEMINLNFEGIYSGFLGSEEQIDIVLEFINENKNSIIIVDPVMGDNGRKYDTYTEKMCLKMKRLVEVAHIITPNITESLILLNKDLNKKDYTSEEIYTMLKELSNLGPRKVVITGVVHGDNVCNYIYDKDLDEYSKIESKYNGKYYSGTGDIFSSIICGLMIQGNDFNFSVNKATAFIEKAVNITDKFEVDTNEGVMFEAILGELIKHE